MTSVRKFLFEPSFDEPEPAPVAPEPPPETAEAAPPPPPPPTFTEADLAAARDQGFATGLAEGRHAMAGEIEARAGAALEAIQQAIGGLDRVQAEANAAIERDAVAVAVAIVRKVFPTISRRHALAEVEALVSSVMPRLLTEPRITIRVNPALREPLALRIEPLAAAAGFEGRVALLADAAVAEGDCRVEWTDGAAERDTAALWQAIDEIVETNLGAADPGGNSADASLSHSGQPQRPPAGAEAREATPAGSPAGPVPAPPGEGR